MYDTNSTFLQAELDYRASRIRSGISGRRQRRLPRVRRLAEAVDAR